MKRIGIAVFLSLGAIAYAQNFQFDYDRSANFSGYRTYQWVQTKRAPSSNQLMDQNIKRAVDEQLAGKGLQRVESGGDLQVAYQAALDHEKQFEGWNSGPRWWGNAHITSSTIDIGKLVIDLYDPGRNQLVWRGAAEKTLDIKKDPDKNYQSLERTMVKLFKNYPPGSGKK